MSLLFFLVPPDVYIDLKDDVNVTAGQYITFTCYSTGFPSPTITWYKDNATFNEDSELSPNTPSITNYTIGTNMTVSQLYLQGIELSDEGQYHCKAYNYLVTPLQSNSETITLHVLSELRMYNCVFNGELK